MFIVNSESYLKLDNVEHINIEERTVKIAFEDGRTLHMNFQNNIHARKYFKKAVSGICSVDVDNIPDDA